MSHEIIKVFGLLAIFFALRMLFPSIFLRLQANVKDYIALCAGTVNLTPTDARVHFQRNAILFATTVLPLLLVTAAATVVLTMGQTRMLFATESLEFKWERINPIAGLRKLFSLRSLVELAKAALKISILGYVVYRELRQAIPVLPRLMDMHPLSAAVFVGELILAIVWRAGAIFVVLAIGDYFYQWWDFERQIRMSKQEIKDEYKQTEGDPLIKGRQRSRRQEAARRRMMAAVPQADVVVRNPTHYAVALKYDPDVHLAPIVVAKGVDHLALKIIRVAEEHEVLVMENKPLARSLFDEVDLEQEIPESFYQTVAEVLAFVYNLRDRENARSGGERRAGRETGQEAG